MNREGLLEIRRQIDTRFGCASRPACIAAKANPFTLGHLYLASLASKREEAVVFFVFGSDCMFDLCSRLEMAKAGLVSLDNVLVLDGSSIFDDELRITGGCGRGNSALVMEKAIAAASSYIDIASSLGLGNRYQGDEPKDESSEIYLNALRQKMKENSLVLKVAERKRLDQSFISSDLARVAVKNGDFAALSRLCPEAVVAFIQAHA